MYTLADYAKIEKEPLRKGILLGLAYESLVADIMPWRTTNALRETGVRFDDVPLPPYVDLGELIPEMSTTGHQVTFTVHQMSGHFDVSTLLTRLTGELIAKPDSQQTMLMIKGASIVLNNTFINGDQAVNPKAFDGLNKLVSNLAPAQTVGATEIDISDGGDSAERQDVIDRIEEGMHVVAGHLPTAAFANSKFLLKFSSILRREGLLGDHYNWKEAALEVNDPRKAWNTPTTRPAFVWRNVPFYDLGQIGGVDVIRSDYAEAGSAGATRLFFVKVGENDLEGIQAAPLEVKEIGPLHDRDVMRWRMSWVHGLALWGPKSISKVQGIKVA